MEYFAIALVAVVWVVMTVFVAGTFNDPPEGAWVNFAVAFLLWLLWLAVIGLLLGGFFLYRTLRSVFHAGRRFNGFIDAYLEQL